MKSAGRAVVKGAGWALVGLLGAAWVVGCSGSSQPDSPAAPAHGPPTPSGDPVDATPTAGLEQYRELGMAAELSELILAALVFQGGCTDQRPSPDALIDALPTAPLRRAATDAFGALAASDSSCADPAAWRSAMRIAADRFLDLEEEIIAAGGQVVVARPAWPPGDADSDTDLTTMITAVNDRLHRALNDTGPLQSTNLWMSTQHLGHTLELRRLVATGRGPDLLIGGSSIGFAVDAARLGALAGMEAFGGSLTGASMPTQQEWLEEIRDLGVAPAVLLLPTSTHELLGCRPGRALAESADRRARVFGAVPHLEGTNQLELLLGPAASPTYPLAPAFYADLFDDGPQALDLTNRGAMDRQRRDFAPTYDDPEICDMFLDTVAELVGDQTRLGGRAIVVVMPIHPNLRSLHPDGLDGHESAFDSLRHTVVANGGSVIDQRAGFEASEFYDLVHLNRSGSGRLTDAVAAALRD